MLSHTNTTPDKIGSATVHTMGCLTMSMDMYSVLDACSMIGIILVDGARWTNYGNPTWR